MPFIGLLGFWFVAELAILIILIIKLGFWFTVGLQLLSSAIGAALLRQRQAAMLKMVQNAAPEPGAARESIYHLSAGILLIIPGILSSLLALVFLIPPLRKIAGAGLFKMLRPDTVIKGFGKRQTGNVYEHEETEITATREDGSVLHGELMDDSRKKH